MAQTVAPRPETDRPIYWFVVLEQSIDAGDLEAAAVAQRELKRLGVTVRYGRRAPHRPQCGYAASVRRQAP
jgi:hypothetical protein